MDQDKRLLHLPPLRCGSACGPTALYQRADGTARRCRHLGKPLASRRAGARRFPPCGKLGLQAGLSAVQGLPALAGRCRCLRGGPQSGERSTGEPRPDAQRRQDPPDQRAVQPVPEIHQRAPSGGQMANMGRDDFISMIENSPIESFVELSRRGGRLVGCVLTDVQDDGLSAVYSFFDPPVGALARHLHDPRPAEIHNRTPALAVSRLLRRRKPEDDVQVPLPAGRSVCRRRWQAYSEITRVIR